MGLTLDKTVIGAFKPYDHVSAPEPTLTKNTADPTMTYDETIKNFPTSDVPPGLPENFPETILSNAKPEIKDILQDPAILHHYKQALDKLIIGEDKNKLLLLLIALTSYMDKVLGAIILGESSAGKSHLMNSVLKFFSNVEEYTRITQAAPDRAAQDFAGRILKIGEMRGADAAQANLRVLISEGKLRLWTTTRNEEGQITDEIIETQGVPALFTTSTNLRPDEELLNRLFLVSIDETEPQTKKVLAYEAQEFMDPDCEELNEPPQPLKDALEFLGSTPFSQTLIPFADQLAAKFPSRSVKARRDFKKLLYIISAVSFLHQMQRPIVYKTKIKQYVVALPVDFYIAWEICEQGLRETLMNVQKRSLEVLDIFKDPNVASLTSRQVADMTRLSQTRAREILNSLVNFGFLLKDVSSKEHSFSLKENVDVDGTIGNFVSSSLSFDEKEFEKWLNSKNLITRYRVWSTEYVNPITGEPASIPPSRVMTKAETEHKPSLKEHNNIEEDTKNAIVPPFELFMTQLHGRVQNPTERSAFVTSIMDLKSCGPEEAEKRFQKLVDEGFIMWFDERNTTKYRWVR